MKKLFVVFLIFAACSSRKKIVVKDIPYDAIEIKSSGGFTGTTTGFSIQRNGEIYVIYHTAGKSYNQKFYRMSTVDSVELMFAKVQSSQILEKPYNKPGNLTYSILSRRDSITNAISWSDGQDSISNYISIYRELRKFASGR